MKHNHSKGEIKTGYISHIVGLFCFTFLLIIIMLSRSSSPIFAVSNDVINKDSVTVPIQSEYIDVSLSFTKIVANGKVNKPSVHVMYNNGTLSEGIDYDISYSGTSILPGKYFVTINFKGYYEGSETLYYYILPKAPSNINASLYGYDDVKVSWSKVEGASGYFVYYKKASESTYSRLGKTNNLYIKKANLADGTKYHFKIVPLYKAGSKDGFGNQYKIVSIATLKTLTTKISRSGFNKVTVRWKDITGQSGYQISRSTKKSGTNIVYTYKTTSGTKAKLITKVGKTYYYKARAYKIYNGKKIYGPWSNVLKLRLSKNYYPKITLAAKKGSHIDIRKEAGQFMYGYSICQGSCTDGTYGYYILYNRNVEKCKIAKMRISDNKVVKVSGVLNIHHGNDLAYNSKTGKILAVHMTEAPKTIAIINPKTLKHEKNQTIKNPSNLFGASRYQLQRITGFNAIAYNEAKDQYVLRIRNVGDYLILNKNLKPIKYVTLEIKKHKNRIYAGLDVADGYIFSAQAASSTNSFERYNILQVHDWSGKYAGTIYIKKGYELESAYNASGMSYAAFYREYYSNGKLIKKNYIYKFDN